MAYTPELNNFYSTTLRRIAWALDTTMTQAIRIVIDHAVAKISKKLVCAKCQDRSRCEFCAFDLWRKTDH
jgi:hypothetical protein